jgi:hypothetical protein
MYHLSLPAGRAKEHGRGDGTSADYSDGNADWLGSVGLFHRHINGIPEVVGCVCCGSRDILQVMVPGYVLIVPVVARMA